MPEKLYTKRDWLHEQRVVKKLSLRKIAILANCTHKTIMKWCRVFNIEPVSSELLSPEYKKFIKEMLENAEKFEGHKFSEREKNMWRKVYRKMWTDSRRAKEKKALKKQDPAHAGRVLHNRQTHPSDRIDFGGGQTLSSRHYEPRASAHTYSEEMELIQEIHDKTG